MIATLTLNPSVDYIVKCTKIIPGETNRTDGEQIYPGGKGINVSIMLKRLGIDSKCMAVKAGATGELLENLLYQQGLIPTLISLKGSGFTRINIKLQENGITEINAKGPSLTPAVVESISQELEYLQKGDLLVIAGRFPEDGTSKEIFSFLKGLKKKGVKLAVDSSGPALRKLMEIGPFLAKPNLKEFKELTGISNTDQISISHAVRQFWQHGNSQSFGAEHILLSMGGDGAILFWDKENIFFAEASSDRETVNTVGAGDCMLAGCLAAFLKGGKPKEILRLAVACGSAAAFSEWIPEKPLPLDNVISEQLQI